MNPIPLLPFWLCQNNHFSDLEKSAFTHVLGYSRHGSVPTRIQVWVSLGLWVWNNLVAASCWQTLTEGKVWLGHGEEVNYENFMGKKTGRGWGGGGWLAGTHFCWCRTLRWCYVALRPGNTAREGECLWQGVPKLPLNAHETLLSWM